MALGLLLSKEFNWKPSVQACTGSSNCLGRYRHAWRNAALLYILGGSYLLPRYYRGRWVCIPTVA